MTVMKRTVLACIFTIGFIAAVVTAAIAAGTGASPQTVAYPVAGACACVWLLLRVLE